MRGGRGVRRRRRRRPYRQSYMHTDTGCVVTRSRTHAQAHTQLIHNERPAMSFWSRSVLRSVSVSEDSIRAVGADEELWRALMEEISLITVEPSNTRSETQRWRNHDHCVAHLHTVQHQSLHRYISIYLYIDIYLHYTTRKISSANMGFWSANIQRCYTGQQLMSSAVVLEACWQLNAAIVKSYNKVV